MWLTGQFMNKIITNSAEIPNGRPFHAHDEQAAKRHRILDSALKLFAHEPYQAVTMDRVAVAAGVAKGTLYLWNNFWRNISGVANELYVRRTTLTNVW